MRILGSVASVIAAIRDEAAVEIEAAVRARDAELAALEGARPREPEAAAAGLAVARLESARRAARERLSREAWREMRESLEARERFIEAAAAAGRRLLAERDRAEDPAPRLARLALPHLEALPGETAEVLVSPEDAARLDPAFAARLGAAAGGRRVRVVAAEVEGGCIVRSEDGRVSFDETWGARARRLEPRWRAALAEIHRS